MKRFLASLMVAVLIGVTAVQAQDYKKSLGVTLGPALGVNGSYFINTTSSIEAQFTYHVNYNAPMLSALYRYYLSVDDDVYAYFGGGINLGGMYVNNRATSRFAFGLDPVIGLEYVSKGYPIAVAVDYMPVINLTSNTQTIWNQLSVKVKYIF